MTRTVEADYVVVGAGASGMAFTDALIDHADVRVALVDRRHGVGGHWLEDYSFVRLHQSSTFYGVASTVLGGHRQTEGPEAGLHERADQATICAYYDDVLTNRLLGSGRVDFYAGCDYRRDRTVVSLVSGEQYEVPEHCRVVDARYLSPDIPAVTPPRFGVAEGARVIPVNDLVRVGGDPEPVRGRGVGQDRDRRHHLAAGAWDGPRCDLLGAAARPVDAEPGVDPAGSRHLPRAWSPT